MKLFYVYKLQCVTVYLLDQKDVEKFKVED
jgi:hypothetical protein